MNESRGRLAALAAAVVLVGLVVGLVLWLLVGDDQAPPAGAAPSRSAEDLHAELEAFRAHNRAFLDTHGAMVEELRERVEVLRRIDADDPGLAVIEEKLAEAEAQLEAQRRSFEAEERRRLQELERLRSAGD